MARRERAEYKLIAYRFPNDEALLAAWIEVPVKSVEGRLLLEAMNHLHFGMETILL